MAAERYKRLSAPEIKDYLPAHTLTDDAHWSYQFQGNGVLSAVDMGRAKRGVWRVERGLLCIELHVKRASESDCYEVLKLGSQLKLLRDGIPILEGTLYLNEKEH